MTWPSGADPIVWLLSDLSGSYSVLDTVTNAGTDGGNFDVFRAFTATSDGGIPALGALGALDRSLATVMQLEDTEGVTIACRYNSEQTTLEDTPWIFQEADGVGGNHRLRMRYQNRSGNTEVRPKHQANFDNNTTSQTKNMGNRTPSDSLEVYVLRVYLDAGTWRFTQYDSTGTDQTANGTYTTPPGTDEPFGYITIGGNQIEVAGLAIWNYDIGDTAADAIVSTDTEWADGSAAPSNIAGSAATSLTLDSSGQLAIKANPSTSLSLDSGGKLAVKASPSLSFTTNADGSIAAGGIAGSKATSLTLDRSGALALKGDAATSATLSADGPLALAGSPATSITTAADGRLAGGPLTGSKATSATLDASGQLALVGAGATSTTIDRSGTIDGGQGPDPGSGSGHRTRPWWLVSRRVA